MKNANNSLPELFRDHFQIGIARTPPELEHVYRVRGDVYCREFRYEREEDCPDGLEMDPYDSRAVHCLITHRSTGRPAGCVRLVTAGESETERRLPFEIVCGDRVSHPILHPKRLPRTTVCEISRLAVHTFFRRRPGEATNPLGDYKEFAPTPKEIRTFPLLSVALFLAATGMVVLSGRHHVYAIMEPRLARMLRRSGLAFKQVGELIEYHGQRAAYHISIEEALQGIRGQLAEFYGLVCDSVNLPGKQARALS
jgi:N-acyl amino acid synthase of PEP-CTERM/exosortase system